MIKLTEKGGRRRVVYVNCKHITTLLPTDDDGTIIWYIGDNVPVTVQEDIEYVVHRIAEIAEEENDARRLGARA